MDLGGGKPKRGVVQEPLGEDKTAVGERTFTGGGADVQSRHGLCKVGLGPGPIGGC